MPQRWDEQGNPVSDAAGAQRWDEHGNSVTAIPPQPDIGGSVLKSIGTRLGQVGSNIWGAAREATTPTPEETRGMQLWKPEAWDPRNLTGVTGALKTVGGGLMDVAELPSSVYHAFADAPQTELEKEKAAGGAGPVSLGLKRLLVGQQPEKFAAATTTGEKIRQGAGMFPVVGPWLEGLSERAFPTEEQRAAGAQYDPIGALLQGTTQYLALKGQAKMMSEAGHVGYSALFKHMTEAERAAERGLAIDRGRTALANEKVSRPIQTYEAGLRARTHTYVESALQAHELDSIQKGNPKSVNLSAAGNAAEELVGGRRPSLTGVGVEPVTGREMVSAPAQRLINEALTEPMSLRRAKAWLGEVGDLWARTKNQSEAAALKKAYDVGQGIAERAAGDVGAGKAWRDYRAEWKVYEQMRPFIQGIMDRIQGGDHAAALKELTHQDNATKVADLLDNMKKYTDVSAVKQAMTHEQALQALTKTTGNFFMGKVKAIATHPLAGIPTLLATHGVGAAIGGPVGGFVLPLIAAGKVAKLLDNAQVMSILDEIRRTTAPGAERAFGRQTGLPNLPPPAGGAVPVPAPAGPAPSPMAGFQRGKGTAVAQMIAEPPKTTPEQVAQSRAAEIERLKGVLRNEKATPEEKSIAESQIKTHEELRAEPQTLYPSEEMEQAELARRLSRAKKSRGR